MHLRKHILLMLILSNWSVRSLASNECMLPNGQPAKGTFVDADGDLDKRRCEAAKAAWVAEQASEKARGEAEAALKAQQEREAAEKAAEEKAKAEEQARKEKEEQERRASVANGGGAGGLGGMGGSGSNPYQASEEPIERHGAIIAPERNLTSTAELPGRTRIVATEKQIADVKEALGLLKTQPVTSEEQKNLNQVLEKFNRGEVDAKTVSDEIAKIATRLEGLQLQLTRAPSNVPQERPDLTLNFGSNPPASNPFSATIIAGDAKAEVDVKQSNEIDVKAKLEKEAAKEKAGLSDGEGSWLSDLLNPGMFFKNVRDAVGWAFGRDFDPSVSKSLRGLASKNKSGGTTGKLGEAGGQYGDRNSAPAIKHVLTLSFLLLPLGAGLFFFFMWAKRKKAKSKPAQTTRFNVQGGSKGPSSKTIFTEKDGTMAAHRMQKKSLQAKKKPAAPTGTSF